MMIAASAPGRSASQFHMTECAAAQPCPVPKSPLLLNPIVLTLLGNVPMSIRLSKSIPVDQWRCPSLVEAGFSDMLRSTTIPDEVDVPLEI